MRIVQVLQNFGNSSAGDAQCVKRLSQQLREDGNHVTVLTLGNRTVQHSEKFDVISADGFFERQLGFSFNLLGRLRKESLLSDILHGHNIWRGLHLFPLLIRNDCKAKVIWSPHGTLSNWALNSKRFRKLPFWLALQRPSLQKSHCLHATSEFELEEFRQAGLRCPVAVIPNGIDVPEKLAGIEKKKTVAYLGRLNEKKGVDLLLRSWKSLQTEFPEWHLEIAGPIDDPFAGVLIELAKTLGLDRVHFLGELLGVKKEAFYQQAAVFALPSHSENFGLVVGEALANATPVVTTTNTPWAVLNSLESGWCIELSQQNLTNSLRMAMKTDISTLASMGHRGRTWVRDTYSWLTLSRQMHETYSWLQGTRDEPPWVFRD